MTGIVILPAGRDDAFEDYKQFIRDGHPIADIESYFDEEDLELFRTTSDNDLVHVWGTSVDGMWRNVERNDIALVYHDGAFVARGQVLRLGGKSTKLLRAIPPALSNIHVCAYPKYPH